MKYGWKVGNELTFGELSRDFYYANLLVDNIMTENLNEVRHLLESKKANPNTIVPERGVAPLHLLAGLENEDFSSTVTLQAILRSGGDPNVRSEEGLTPVHVAAMWGRCKVLEILLVNGGDPELMDYKMFLSAEDYAIKEQQWEAYGVICTFSVMREEEIKVNGNRCLEERSHVSESSSELSKLSNKKIVNKNLLRLKEKETNYNSENSSIKDSESSGTYSTVRKNRKLKGMNAIKRKSPVKHEREIHKANQTEAEMTFSDWSRNSVKSLTLNDGALSSIKMHRRNTNVYESVGSISDEGSTIKKYTNGPREKCNKLSLYGDAVSESCDWIRKSSNSISLNKQALDTIKNQRLSSKIYQTIGIGEDPLKEREKKPPIYEESETCDWVNPRDTDEFEESSLNKIKIHRQMATNYNSEDQGNSSTFGSGPKLPKRNRKTHQKKKENSEMYLYGYTEESIRPHANQRRSLCHSSGLSDVDLTDFDGRGIPNQRVLCKMSRIFLFMLKKRHIYQKIK